MEVIIRLIGIILLYCDTSVPNKTTWIVYLPDVTKERSIGHCSDANGNHPPVRPHTPAIRTHSASVGHPPNWGPRSCNDGFDCQLFALPTAEIKITGVTQQGGTVAGNLDRLPHLYKDNYFSKLDTAALTSNSAAHLTIDAGTISSEKFSDGQKYAILHVHLAAATDIVVTAGPNNLTIPKDDVVEFDIVNIPTEHDGESSGIPEAGGHNDFLAYYLYSAADEHCIAPSDTTGTMLMKKAIPISRSLTTRSKQSVITMDDGGDVSTLIGGNADCSSSTWP
jgi:hypothetical protein